MGVRGSVAFSVLPHHKNRDVLPPGQQAQALLRHLCLEKGNALWDIETKALFGFPESMDTVGDPWPRGATWQRGGLPPPV